MRIAKVDNYFSFNDDGEKLLQIQSNTELIESGDGTTETVSITYYVPLPVLTNEGPKLGLQRIDGVNSLTQAFIEGEKISKEYLEKLQSEINKARIMAPPSTSEQNKLQLVRE